MTDEVKLEELSQEEKDDIILRLLKGKIDMASILYGYGDHWKYEPKKTSYEASSKIASWILRGV